MFMIMRLFIRFLKGNRLCRVWVKSSGCVFSEEQGYKEVVQLEENEKVEQLKIQDIYFEDVAKGIKTFEIRKNDRMFYIGQIFQLCEVDQDSTGDGWDYTGRYVYIEVTYILNDLTYTAMGYVAFGIKLKSCIQTFHK